LFTDFEIKRQSISLETGLVNHHDYFETPILFSRTSALLETMGAFAAFALAERYFIRNIFCKSQPNVKTKTIFRR
jgi:hypothetical protein